jgi:hypothetical protein
VSLGIVDCKNVPRYPVHPFHESCFRIPIYITRIAARKRVLYVEMIRTALKLESARCSGTTCALCCTAAVYTAGLESIHSVHACVHVSGMFNSPHRSVDQDKCSARLLKHKTA